MGESTSLLEGGIGLVSRRWRLIGLTTVLTVLVALLFALAAPQRFRAETTLLPRESAGGTSLLLAGLTAQLGAGRPSLPGLGTSKGNDLMEFLNSRTLLDRVITRLSLDKEIRGWKTREDLRKRVRKATTIIPASAKNNSLTIQTTASRADLAAAMANTYVRELKSLLDEVGYNDASKNRSFVERQLNRSKIDLKAAEEALADYQARNRLVSLPETVQSSIKALGDLEARYLESRISLEATDESLSALGKQMASFQTPPDALLELQVKREGLLAQKAELEKARRALSDRLDNLPPQGLRFGRLTREVQIQNAIFMALTQQMEAALIAEAKDSDTFLVLDEAVVPEEPVWPKKQIILLGALLGGLALGVAVAFAAERSGRISELRD